MDCPVDINEQNLYESDPKILDILLMDQTTKKNILWASSSYAQHGPEYSENMEIVPSQIIGINKNIIRPRIAKHQHAQLGRTRDKAEVFTPAWLCNLQNNLIDDQWFGRKDIFNIASGISWEATEAKIECPNVRGKTWQDYADLRRIEVTCGEAPYLVSRYDTTTGAPIPIKTRIGLLDRKFRIINENTSDETQWFKWAERAIQSVYGYDYQGDNILLARENLLFCFCDNMEYQLGHGPSHRQLMKIAKIISWNIWQMDGIKYTAPFSHNETMIRQTLLFEMDEASQSEEIPCNIRDWRSKKTIQYRTLIKEEHHGIR